MGRPITLLCRGMDNGTRDRVLHYAFASTRGSKLGPTFDLPLLWATKKRHAKMLARSQFFFNDAVRVRATSFVCVCRAQIWLRSHTPHLNSSPAAEVDDPSDRRPR